MDSLSTKVDLYPYPPSSPVDTGEMDERWVTAASNVPIFRLEPACTEIRLRKSDHLQFYLWTALERTNRLKRKDIWFYGDMCDRDPCHAGLEQMFMHLWWSQAVKIPLRRFPNNDVVLPLTAKYYRKIYGDKAMEWPVINNETEEVGVMQEEVSGLKKEDAQV
ncbi:hypothetical protein HYE68_003850 [Fusarium pseudograminearum]|nr:hypothetical protein HYE68_003850 [Fusarium pseudograminearum]